MSKIYFTSDNHFSHRNIHKFCPATRPHSDPKEMDEAMIEMWNKQVSGDDTVWMLGDVFFSQESEAKNILRRLNGHKNLVYGNHDKVIRKSYGVRELFESVQEYKELNLVSGRYVLFHYPIQEWNHMSRCATHLHGHIHDRLSGVPGKIINVCIDSPELSKSDAPYCLYEESEVSRLSATKEVRQHHGKIG